MLFRQQKLSQQEKVHILTRMSQLLEQGYSFMQTLEIILTSSSRKQRYWIEKLMETLEQGKSVEEGFRNALFSEYVSIMIAQAEWHGNMAQALKQAYMWKSRKLKMKREWQKVLVYPAILIIILFSILYLIFHLVIPQFIVMFQTFRVDVPAATKNTLLFFQWWKDYYLILFTLIVIIILIFYLLYRLPHTRVKIINFLLKFSWTRMLPQTYFTILFTMQLGSLLQANIPLYQSMKKVKERCGSTYLQQRIQIMEEKIFEGQSVGDVVQAECIFTPELYPVIYYAEKNGKLGNQLVQFGMFLEAETMDTWLNRIKFMEPILLLCIGTFIAYLFFALFHPILELIKVI